MTWTEEKPKVPGWWWHRRNPNDRDAQPRWVGRSRDGVLVKMENGLFLVAQVGGQWSDKPIPEPEEPDVLAGIPKETT